jgi:hypothetical protein
MSVSFPVSRLRQSMVTKDKVVCPGSGISGSEPKGEPQLFLVGFYVS